ncbi:MAG: hypothetical protein QOE92_897 [Chloroflexota bacterium]|jgi:polyisoprenoid-binding protein YceI|nr:hypothetical protein [Chloroflexota bacterium]
MATAAQQLTVAPATGTYALDMAHSTVGFEARHMVFTRVRGHFGEVEGGFVVAEDPDNSSVDVTIKAASIDSGVADRDVHLRSGDFLDVEKYPDIRFRSTGVNIAGPTNGTLSGELTIRDITRPVVLDVEYLGGGVDPYGREKAALSASTEIDREDWGLTWNVALETGGVLVSKKIKIDIEVAGVLQK